MTLEQQLSALCQKHDLLSIGITVIDMSDGSYLISADSQCNVHGVRNCFNASETGGDASILLSESIEKANAARIVPAEVEQLAGIAA